jgi:two-component system, cell cycle sensor histidine kinase and response regulator CckA
MNAHADPLRGEGLIAAAPLPGGPVSDEDDLVVLPFDSGPLVLVVDDELTPRSIVTRLVRTLGYQARSCPGGLPALRFLEAHPGAVRLLLADLDMPRMDGGELAERARDLDPRLRVVLMAGPGDAHVDALLAGYRDVPFLPKPVSLGALAEALEDLLGAPGRLSDARLPMPPRPRARRRSSGHHQI